MGVAERDQDVMLNDTAGCVWYSALHRTRDELVQEHLEMELRALIASRELEMYDLEHENAYLSDRLEAEDRRLAHA